MKEISIDVAVYLDMDYLSNTELSIQVSNEVYSQLSELCEVIEAKELEDSEAEDFLKKETPDVFGTLMQAIDTHMPDNIEIEEGEDLGDYSWSPNFSMISLN